MAHEAPSVVTFLTGDHQAMLIRRPIRATRTYTQHLAAEPDRVFPLLCPVREADWLEDWDPLLVVSESGIAEPACAFVTSSGPRKAVWFISRYEPERWFLEFIKVTPEVTVCRLTVLLAPSSGGTDATITYSHTSLGPEGDAFVAGFTEEFYEGFMHDWELRMNHYLATGEILRSGR